MSQPGFQLFDHGPTVALACCAPMPTISELFNLAPKESGMKYEHPELFQIGNLETHTFGGNKEASQDGTYTYRKNHGDTDVASSFQKACAVARANRL